MLSDPLQESHAQALAVASEETGIPMDLLEEIICKARQSSRLRTRSMGSVNLEAAVESIARARRSE